MCLPLPFRMGRYAMLALALVAIAPPFTSAQQPPTTCSPPEFNDPAGPDGMIGTADDDYRPSKPRGSCLLDAGQTGVGLTDALDIDDDGNTSEPLPGPFAAVDRNNGSAPDLGYAESSGGALPVELMALDAHLQSEQASKSVSLSWRTASETGNAGFAVQRRTPAANDNWTTVGRVEGAGTTARPQRYRFKDNDIPFTAERLTYRLRQIDNDGSTTVSDSVTVTRSATRLTLTPPFPNPARTETSIQVTLPPSTDGPITLHIYDLMGRHLRTHSVDASDPRQAITIDTGDLASGTYVLHLRGAEATRTRRLTVLK